MSGSNGQGTHRTAGAHFSRRATAVAALTVATAMCLGVLRAHAGGFPVNGSSQGYLGVGLRDVGEDQLNALKLKEARGAEILSVDHDGPAGKIGLRVHDVILQMNGEVIQGQEQLRRMLHETPAGRSVTLVISRDGQQQTLQTQLAKRDELERKAWEDHLTVPEPQTGEVYSVEPAPPAPGGRVGGGPSAPGSMGFLHGGGLTGHTRSLLSLGGPYTGALVEPVGPQLAQFFGVSDGTGLLVKNVDTNSPAATAGLRAGDVVLKANQTTLSNPGDWSRVMHQSKGQAVSLTVVRDRKQQTLTLTPDTKHRSAMNWPFDSGFADVPPLDTGALVAELQQLQIPDLAAARDAMRAGQGALTSQDLTKLLGDAQRNTPSQAEIGKMLDDAKRNLPNEVELQKMLRDAQRNTPSQAEIGKMLDDAKRNLPNEVELQKMLNGAGHLRPDDLNLELQWKDLQHQFGPGSQLDLELNDLREQMMLAMPGSMD